MSALTNIVASIIVTLSTNVTERFPTHQEQVPCAINEGLTTFQYAVYCAKEVPDANPTNKWVRTTVTRWTTIEVQYDGPRRINIPEVISDHEVEYVLRQEWVSLPIATNILWLTNQWILGQPSQERKP